MSSSEWQGISSGIDATEADIALLIKNYNGPILIERLYHVFKKVPSLADKVALQTLKQMEKYQAVSPFYKELMEALSNLEAPDKIYGSKQWINKLMYDSKSEIMSLSSILENERSSLGDDETFQKSKKLSTIYSIQHEFQLAIDSLNFSHANKSTFYCSELFVNSQNAIFKKNYSQILINSKRVDGFLSQLESNETMRSSMKESEAQMAWNVRWLEILAKFSLGHYQDLSETFFKILNSAPILGISSVDSLSSESFNVIVTKNDLILMASLSILLVKPPRTLPDILSDETFNELLGPNQSIRDLFDALYLADYKKVQEILNNFEAHAQLDLFLEPIWHHFRLVLRQKIYLSYLSATQAVFVEHMFQKLAIPVETIISEVVDMIQVLNLKVKFDAVEKVFFFEPEDDRSRLIESISNTAEEFDINSRALAVYSLVTKSLISESLT